MKQPERFILTQLERESPLWLRLTEEIEARIELLRRKNDGDIGELETANLRGRIAAYKALLDLNKEQLLVDIPIT